MGYDSFASHSAIITSKLIVQCLVKVGHVAPRSQLSGNV